MSTKSLLRSVEYRHSMNPTLRYGQILLEVLEEQHPLVAEMIRGTDVDPSLKAERKDCARTMAHLFDIVNLD